MRKSPPAVRPVSYTHLDVYKRQLYAVFNFLRRQACQCTCGKCRHGIINIVYARHRKIYRAQNFSLMFHIKGVKSRVVFSHINQMCIRDRSVEGIIKLAETDCCPCARLSLAASIWAITPPTLKFSMASGSPTSTTLFITLVKTSILPSGSDVYKRQV